VKWQIEQRSDEQEYHLYDGNVRRAVIYHYAGTRQRQPWWAVLFSVADGLSTGGAHFDSVSEAFGWCEGDGSP